MTLFILKFMFESAWHRGYDALTISAYRMQPENPTSVDDTRNR
jgi:hypothetical protein